MLRNCDLCGIRLEESAIDHLGMCRDCRNAPPPSVSATYGESYASPKFKKIQTLKDLPPAEPLHTQEMLDFIEEWAKTPAAKQILPAEDVVNQPSHYKAGGIESIQVIEAFGLGFNLGNLVKYVLRAGRKDPDKDVEDLRKARYYLDREIATRESLKKVR